MPRFQPPPRPYELMVLLNPELADEALEGAVDRVSQTIDQAGGQDISVKRDQPWGRRRLAYPIQRFRDAIYVLYHFDSPTQGISNMERELKLNEQVIRYLVVRREEEETEEVAQPAEEAPEEEVEPANAEAAEVSE